ncbi:hypothetical protein CH352_14370 [Leptospira hartskeerlii]|uniref:DUF302 domain-containing protein n=1 Tax=Leptospira hartskeerlii TaxID=2023177 RepID=A0A2M9X9P0_9LEPT|nr:DUF302 domain-containing protein [Leptospira hartskeerlii]PJZ24410.1 hypothetical protein CH357_15135 [Leptospira hartskeerlii]PJZ32978.1 hypothetical protein CH352_14370 [Leptospira hartskeerlii]
MKYIVDSEKSVEQASLDLQKNVVEAKYGVLHIHDLKETMKKKGVEFQEECRIFEVCNPARASKVLNEDMEMNFALPCRISVYTDHGKTRIGMIRPEPLLRTLSDSKTLAQEAKEVEDDLIRIIQATI